MVIAILRPSNEPSESRSSKMAFRTGACWATQSILRRPSGARLGSLTIDSSIIALLLRLTNSCSSPQFTGQEGGMSRPLPLSPELPEQALQYLRAVCHDDVHPEVQQPVHLRRIVYRPHVHPHPPGMGGPEKSRRDELDPPVLDGHLERIVGRGHERLEM